MKVFETGRLVLRRLCDDDAPFIFGLVNDPDWLRYIGDKGVRSLEDARHYIRNGPVAMYERHGFGLWRVELKDGGAPIGLCGLIKRDSLEDVDLGYAFLPGFRGRGYAYEAAAASIAHAKDVFGMQRLVAITSSNNAASISLLERAGFRFERMLPASPDAEPLKLFGKAL